MSSLFHFHYSAAIWQIIVNYCCPIEMHYVVKNGAKWGKRIWIFIKI